MAYVRIPKDLTKVRTKFALGLTQRQLVCFERRHYRPTALFFTGRYAVQRGGYAHGYCHVAVFHVRHV